MALLLHLADIDEATWQRELSEALDGYPVYTRSDAFDAAEIRYILVWKPAPDAFAGLGNLKAVLSLGAGVDALLRHPALPDAPVVRFVDEELSQCMSDYVVAQVTMHHRLFTRYHADQKAHRWSQLYPPPAPRISVGMMGLGVLGCDALERLRPLGFTLLGWSRSEKSIAGVTTYAGKEAFDAFLAATDILVNLLPLTAETEGILNYRTFAKLRRDGLEGGPAIVNAARGGHQVEPDIVRALKDGTLGAASIDVFNVEPLPADSPLWDVPNCYLTPHIAAISHLGSGVRYFSGVIRDHEAGGPLTNVVDKTRGY